jgi:hypothetical protein
VPVPPNNTAGAAIEVTLTRSGSFRTTVDVRDSGTNYDTWWKITPTFSGTMGLWLRGDEDYVFAPEVTVYSDAGLTEYYGGAFADIFASPMQFPVVANDAIWVKADPDAGNAAADGYSTLTVEIYASPVNAFPPGSIVIPDDSGYAPSFEAIVYSPDGEVLGFLPMEAGDSGDALASGYILQEAFNTGGSRIYRTGRPAFNEAALVPVADVAQEPIGVKGIRAVHGADAWYIRPVTAVNGLRRVGIDGTVGAEINTGASTVNFAVLNDESLILRATASAGANIETWNIAGAAAGADFAAGIANYAVQGILVLEDGTVVVGFYDPGGGDDATIIRHYAADGSTLADYTAGDDGTYLISYGYPINEQVVYWTQDGGAEFYSRFRTIALEDMSVLNDFTTGMTVDGTNFNLTVTVTSETETWGNETSCPIFVLQQPIPIPPINLSVPCCPCDCPIPVDPFTSSPALAPLQSTTGAILPPVDPSWLQACAGGGTVPTQADATDAESWL